MTTTHTIDGCTYTFPDVTDPALIEKTLAKARRVRASVRRDVRKSRIEMLPKMPNVTAAGAAKRIAEAMSGRVLIAGAVPATSVPRWNGTRHVYDYVPRIEPLYWDRPVRRVDNPVLERIRRDLALLDSVCPREVAA